MTTETKPKVLSEEEIAYPCPECGAAAGEECRTMVGYHAVRRLPRRPYSEEELERWRAGLGLATIETTAVRWLTTLDAYREQLDEARRGLESVRERTAHLLAGDDPDVLIRVTNGVHRIAVETLAAMDNNKSGGR